jgi:hypothetical protein
MRYTRFVVTLLLAAGAAFGLTAQSQQPPAQPPAGQDVPIRSVITGYGGPPKLAVPAFIPLSKEPEVIAAAKTIGEVLWDDMVFEKEFYMIPKDMVRTVAPPASADQVEMGAWKELGADAVGSAPCAKAPAA